MFFGDLNLAFIDIESTGLDKNIHEIIELGLIIYDQKNDTVKLEWETKIKPIHIETASIHALEINGFNKNAELYTNDLETEIAKFNRLASDCIPVGQNISFDLGFIFNVMKKLDIKPLFNNRRYLDTMSLSWQYIRNQDIKDLSLYYLCDHLGISNEGAHGALIDCKRTLEVYRKLMKIYGAL